MKLPLPAIVSSLHRLLGRKVRLSLDGWAVKCHQISLVKRGGSRKCTDSRRAIPHIDERQRQRKGKAKGSGQLVQDRMHCHKFLLPGIAHDNVRQLDGCDARYPEVYPDRKLHHGKQLYQAHRRKKYVCSRVEPCAPFTDAVRLPGHGSIQHVRKPRKQIKHIESRRQYRAKEQCGAGQRL